MEMESQTRRNRIDTRLKALGWTILPFRPGLTLNSLRSTAITEYETANGPADYALVLDGQLVGVLEANFADSQCPCCSCPVMAVAILNLDVQTRVLQHMQSVHRPVPTEGAYPPGQVPSDRCCNSSQRISRRAGVIAPVRRPIRASDGPMPVGAFVAGSRSSRR